MVEVLNPEAAPEPAGANAARKPARILVVEDDAEFRTLVAWSLRRDGHEVVELADPVELLDFLQLHALVEPRDESPADLVVTDLRMPGFDGFELLVALGSLHAQVPVVLMTAFAEDDTRDTALLLGAAAVLEKPFASDELRGIVRGALGAA
jgi:CheY-like chemotaxis protein